MKRILMLISVVLNLALMSLAQSSVIEETFDNNELSWTENSKPFLGEDIIMDGKFNFDSKEKSVFIQPNGSYRPTLLLSEGVMPIDPQKGFTISTDMEFTHMGIFGQTFDSINLTSGILLGYDDDYNFIAIAVNEVSCYVLFFREGQLVRYKTTAVKMKKGEKNKILANLKVEYRDYKLKIYVDDIEMTEVRKVEIDSPTIALFCAGKRKMSFDNVIISQ